MSTAQPQSESSAFPSELDEISCCELTIIMDRGWSRTEFIGTRTQLEDEGVIPIEIEWPDGFRSVSWDANGLCYWMQRQRPEGAKGPRRDFLKCDNWYLRVDSTSWDYDRSVIETKANELRQLLVAQSPEGKAERSLQRTRYSAAVEDKKFQAFKVKVPAIAEQEARAARHRKHRRIDGQM
ncbi:hypothetical protein [Burkholderia sp. BCC1977]|uniref:hypothetical protein n=1 Tax=Burkholderia sp. BCC1977 TaxID=2817440 RepID=UPI002ABDF2BE|nr:hypothetical protein [Burkholderia sp. BCC1977]